MIYGHICRNSLRSAREEIEGLPSEVWCNRCEEETELTIMDFGFDDHFGGVSDYEVVTQCCEGSDWEKLDDLLECSICEKKFLEEKMDFDYYQDYFEPKDQVVCERCSERLLGPDYLANIVVEDFNLGIKEVN